METDAGVNKHTLHFGGRPHVTSLERIQPTVEFPSFLFPAVLPEQAQIRQNPLNVELNFQALVTPICQVLLESRTLGGGVLISNNLNDASYSMVVLNLDEHLLAQGGISLSFVIYIHPSGYNNRFYLGITPRPWAL